MKQVNMKKGTSKTQMFLSVALVAILMLAGLGTTKGYATGRELDSDVKIVFYTEEDYRGITKPDGTSDPKELKDKLAEIHGKKSGEETASSFATLTDADSGVALTGKPGSELGPLPTTGSNSLVGATFVAFGVVLLGVAYLLHKRDSRHHTEIFIR